MNVNVLLAASSALLLGASQAPPPAAFSPVAVQEIVLGNGFRLVVVEDRRVPRVAASLWYRFGAMQEPNGEHGEAHFLEHALHQGTTTVGTTNFEAEKPILRKIHETEQKLLALRNRERNSLRERRVFYDHLDWPTTPEMESLRRELYALEDQDSAYRDFWAEYNWYRRYGAVAQHSDPVPATTGYERMEIDVDFPKENLELLFRIEADRMVNAVLRGWEAQRYTVLEQILNRHSRPETNLHFALDGVRGWGHTRDFNFFNRASMLRMYDDYFVPNNTTLALVGDVSAERARELGQRYFGRIPRGPEPTARMELEAEPVPRAATRLEWSEPLYPGVIVRYRVPGVGHPDRPAFDAVAALLRGRHGMLGAKVLGERGPATSLTVDLQLINTYRLGSPGGFNIVVRARRDEDLPAVEAAIEEVIGELEQGRVDPRALERARKAMRLEWEQIRSSRSQLAYEFGTFQVMDSWKTLLPFMETRERVSPQEIQRIAREYFVPANRTVARSRSKPSGGGS